VPSECGLTLLGLQQCFKWYKLVLRTCLPTQAVTLTNTEYVHTYRYGDPKPGHMHWRRDRLGDIQRIPPTPTRADHIGHAARIQSGRQLGVSKVYWTNNNVTSSSPLPPRASGSVSALPGQHEQLEQTFPDFTSRHPVSVYFTLRRGDVTKYTVLQKNCVGIIFLNNSVTP